MSILGLAKSVIWKLRKPKLFNKKISSTTSSKGNIIITFNDGKTSRFYRRYASKLLKGNVIEFYGYSKGDWIKPAKSPKLKVLEQAPVEKVSGDLQIRYVSRFMNDENGEYVYLPDCLLKTKDGNNKKAPALIYLENVGLKFEELGIFQGYGVIQGSFSLLGDIISVDKIDDFRPDIKTIKEEAKISEAIFRIGSLSIKTENGEFYCPSKNVPFRFTPTHNEFKKLYSDMTIKITAQQRKIGKVNKVGNKWVEIVGWTQIGEPHWDFSSIDNSKVAQAIKQQKMDKEYEKLLQELKQLKEFVSFSEIKKKFKKTGRKVSNKDLSEMFFHPGYDEDIFHILENSAIETFVDNLSFIFKVPTNDANKSKYIWEVPNRTLATYIFDDTLKPNQLFSRLKETMRMDIRTNKDIQKALGFVGFIIHTNTESWNEKFKLLLK